MDEQISQWGEEQYQQLRRQSADIRDAAQKALKQLADESAALRATMGALLPSIDLSSLLPEYASERERKYQLMKPLFDDRERLQRLMDDVRETRDRMIKDIEKRMGEVITLSLLPLDAARIAFEDDSRRLNKAFRELGPGEAIPLLMPAKNSKRRAYRGMGGIHYGL